MIDQTLHRDPVQPLPGPGADVYANMLTSELEAELLKPHTRTTGSARREMRLELMRRGVKVSPYR